MAVNLYISNFRYMKHRFLFYLVFMIVGVVFIDIILGYAFRSLERISFEKNPKRFEVRARYAIEKAESEVAIIGASDASHSYISQMIEDSLHLSTFNYGKDGCFFIYQNCLINMMLEKHSPKVILWEIGKDCLSTTPAKKVTEWQSISDFYPYYDNNSFCKQLIDQKETLQHWYMLSSLYRYNSKALTIIEPFIVNEIVPDTKGYVALPNMGYKYPSFDVTETKDNIDPWKVDLLNHTLDVCKGNDIAVVFCFSPSYGEYGFDTTEQYKKLLEVAKTHGVGVIDYKSNSQFMADSTLFKDPKHLNDRGAHFYMEHFIPDLKNLLAEQ